MIKEEKIFNGDLSAEYISGSTRVRRNNRWNKQYSRVHKNNCIIHFLFLLIILSISFLTNGQASRLILRFENKAGDKTLQTDSVYQNSFGELFTIRNFKYYISNIVLQGDNKSQSFPDEYFLIDQTDSASRQIELETTLQHISSFHFLLGVDSLKNVNGVQTGSLDPAKGMFWTWNSGYVMAKLEGNFPVAQTPAHAFSYHVGGYKQNEKTAREINFILPHIADCSHAGCTVTIEADILKWFNATHEIKIADTPFCHEPASLATKLADNYASMFSVADVQ